MTKNIKSILTLVCIITLLEGLPGCGEEVEKSTPKIENLEGIWISNHDGYKKLYGKEYEGIKIEDKYYFSAPIIRITRCLSNCYQHGEVYESYTYDYHIEIGKVEDVTNEPHGKNYMINYPNFNFEHFVDVAGDLGLVRSSHAHINFKNADTLKLISVTMDSLIIDVRYGLEFNLGERKFIRTELPDIN
ncbi:MAG: hypothetical protein RIC03_16230 [Cyclobacteriaceae bacterium]